MNRIVRWLKKLRCIIIGHQWNELARREAGDMEYVLFVCNNCSRVERHNMDWGS